MRGTWLLAAALVACAPRSGGRAIAPPPSFTGAVDGVYWLAAGFDGPPQARLVIGDGNLTIHPLGGLPAVSMRISPDKMGFEARAATGATLDIQLRPDGGLAVVGADGGLALAWRVGPPPPIGGRWVLRDVGGGERDALFVPRAGTSSMLTLDESLTYEIWPLVRPEVDAAWIRIAPSGEAWMEIAVARTDGSWLVREPRGPTRVLYRRGDRPTWLPPAPPPAPVPAVEPDLR